MGYKLETLFLEASEDVLVSRYKETRRDHPLAIGSTTLMAAIQQEKEMLMPLRETADYVIDTTVLKPRKLQQRLQELVTGSARDAALRVEVMSFGFKRGLPRQADLVFDVRFLTNPFYIEELKHHTGLEAPVRDFVMNHPTTIAFMDHVRSMLTFLLPHYREEGKHRLVIAVGCTGGAHRSVAITESVAAFLREAGYPVEASHRDLQLEQAHWRGGTESASGDE